MLLQKGERVQIVIGDNSLSPVGDPGFDVVQYFFWADQIDGLTQQSHTLARPPRLAERATAFVPSIVGDGRLGQGVGSIGHTSTWHVRPQGPVIEQA